MDLWVQQIEGGDPVQLTRGLGCRNPAFSPDGSRIVMSCGGEPSDIYVVSTFGGLPRKLGEGDWPRFSPDGAYISYVSTRAEGSDPTPSIRIIPADGGTAKEFKVEKRLSGGPVWSQDSKGLFFIGYGDPQARRDERDWYFLSADGGSPRSIGAQERLRTVGFEIGRDLALTSSGLLFAEGDIDSTNLYRMPLDTTSQNVSGDPVPLVVGAGYNFSPTASKDGRRIAFAIGNNLSVNIWRAPIDANTGKVLAEPVRVTTGIDPNRVPSPSLDGKRVAYLAGSTQAPEVRIRDIATGKDLRLAQAKGWSYVVLSRDGSTVVFNSDERDNSSIYSVAATGGMPKKICGNCGRPVEWSLDGTKLLFDNAGPKRRDIHILDVATGVSKALLQHTQYPVTMPRISPDGKLLCFSGLQPGRARRLYLASFTGEPVPENEWTVLVDGSDLDRQPFWAPSGNLIYFISDRDGSRCIWAQRVDTANRKPVGTPFAVQHMHQIRHNLVDVGDPAAIGLSLAGGQMFYASFELHANIWLAESLRRGSE